jgi:hypothetical protein
MVPSSFGCWRVSRMRLWLKGSVRWKVGSTTKGLRRFLQGLAAEQQRIAEAFPATDEELLREHDEQYWRYLFEYGPEPKIDRGDFDYPSWWYSEMFRPVSSIVAALSALEDAPIYARSFPYRNGQIQRARHLERIVLCAVQDVYNLRERIFRLFAKLGEHYPDHEHVVALEAICDELCTYIKDVLKPLNEARRLHVHEFGVLIQDLDRVSTLELYAGLDLSADFSVAMTSAYEVEYRRTRARWVQQLGVWGTDLGRVVGTVCDTIYPFLFDSRGRFRPPKKWAERARICT